MGPSIILNICCPHCHESLQDPFHLMDGVPSISLNTESEGRKGRVWLSPAYGDYRVETEHEITQGSIATFRCPKCQQELKGTVLCDLCEAPMVPLLLKEGGRVWICSRRGCKKHFLEFENINDALAKFYEVYGVGGG